ncbi:release factor glutamine methyltransferase [Actinopolyspora biskrensis]|uniref:Release factor glutamine methyltransferase n=1 Tax=Actinopolyspora biskrensis TaxID=1470178 RepID=A0A852YSF0_9ACTN|nr:methyltransferase [Actinopolyspora biskrensis]NYH76818.1 release factor glutamine methyltransferase [Actinopolyspora biskrensis]
MSATEVERVRRWHERAYRAALSEGSVERTFSYLGRTIGVPPSVQPILPVSHLLGEAVLSEVRPGDRVLDMGTGSGVNAVLAASVASEVCAVDVNPAAVRAARDNAELNGVAERVRVLNGDVFDAVTGLFDLIVFDPPFRWFAARDATEAAITDPGYRTLTTFFTHVRRHLARKGRMLVFFGTSGDVDYLLELAAEQELTVETVAETAVTGTESTTRYHTFRMS